jgi:hypothetical protein
MPITEPAINDALAGVLRETRRSWLDTKIVRSENTGMIKGGHERPDILVLEPNVSPVAVETEVLPAATVEREAISRLGKQIAKTGRTILSAVAVRLPPRLRNEFGNGLTADLRSASDIEMALYTGSSPDNATRWPSSGWISGTIADLSILTQSATIPPDVIEMAADELVAGVSEAAAMLDEMSTTHAGAMKKICAELRQADGEQTRRMATTILANAFMFQESLAGGVGGLSDVKSIEELRTDHGFAKSAVLSEWQRILKVNYWPIFDIARRLLEVVPATSSKTLIERLASTAEKLLQNRLMRSHDLMGAVFQKLIADRKFLAAYYTTPSSASLLIGLAINATKPLAGSEWSDPERLRKLRIADFACGTGTLISTAYQRIGQMHELAGGDSEALHSDLMGDTLIGCDVLPAAAHLTASMLSGSHPTVKYKKSSIMTVAYGRQPNGIVALGSIDLLDPQAHIEVIAITAKSAGGEGESDEQTWAAFPHDSFDLVVMNPPFTRSTGQEGKKKGVPNPMFAAFSATKADQKLMAKATRILTKGTSYHGNAGEASIFLVLADRKLKEGGVLAIVMPLSLLSGEAWTRSRAMLAKKYIDIAVVSIAGAENDEMSFSADTGMGECLLVARKARIGSLVGKEIKPASDRATFVVLNERPESQLLGATAARQISLLIESGNLRRIEDGPVGGTPVYFGDEVIGQALNAPVPLSGAWNPTRVSDLTLAQAAYQLGIGEKLWLPSMSKGAALPSKMTTIGQIAKVGPYHADIDGLTQTKSIRGPFARIALTENHVPTYPILWEHNAGRERTISFEADFDGIPRKGRDEYEQEQVDHKVSAIADSASHCHYNKDFRFNSQSTAMQYTQTPTIGGHAWPSLRLASKDQEKALVLWGNTSLGILLYWYHSNKQQAGRGRIVLTSVIQLPVLDVRKLSKEQLNCAAKLFDDFRKRPLRPINEIDQDEARAELDNRFCAEVLIAPNSFTDPEGPLALLRQKLAKEPSIRGGKDSVDESAGLDDEGGDEDDI